MLLSKDTKFKCDVCGREEYGLPCVACVLIDPNPIVCEKCFFEKITGKKYVWTQRMEEYFLKNKWRK